MSSSFFDLPESVQKSFPANCDSYFIRTYATEAEINKLLDSKASQIKASAYILHDADNSTPHFHVVLVLNRSRAPKDIYSWFVGLMDNDGTEANFHFEVVKSMDACHKYLTHSDDKSRQEGKHQYKEEDIKVSNPAPWDFLTKQDKSFRARERKNESADEIENLLDDIRDHVPMRQMARRYGRDYIKNRKAYHEYVFDMMLQEGESIDDALKVLGIGTQQLIQDARDDAMTEGLIRGLRTARDMLAGDTYNKVTVSAIDTILTKINGGITK